MKCWETRGCEGPDNNFDHCPHAMLNGKCAVDCRFAYCERPTHKQASALDILDPNVDRDAAVKEFCSMCTFFIQNGPRLADRVEGEAPAWKLHYAQYYQDPSAGYCSNGIE